MDEQTACEHAIRRACTEADFDRATTLVIEAYGSEILSFLAARLRAESDGREAFSLFAEDVWRGLPTFAWRCSIRAWSYTVARNAAHRYARSPRARAAPLRSDHIALLAEQVRSTTRVYLQTGVKDRVRELRERLAPDDQMLLILRVDRELSWRELAVALSGNPGLSEHPIASEAARLRKAFERLKTQLKRMAHEAGLLEDDA